MKEIILSSGQKVIVDDDDYERLSNFKWYYSSGYAVRYSRINGKQKTWKMCWDIIGYPDGQEVDHINHNKLDERKCNLRFVTHSQNMHNYPLQTHKDYKYKGVCLHKASGKWIAQIKVNGKKMYLGTFSDILDAVEVYNQAAKEYHGEYAFVNNNI